MLSLFFQVTNIAADIIVFFFAGYFLFIYLEKEKQLEKKEKELKQKEGKIDTEYHQIVDNALNKERKILEDAAGEADVILSQAQFATQTTQEKVNKALEQVIAEVHKETAAISHNFLNDFQNSIKQLANQSISDLQSVSKEMTDIQKAAVQNTQNFTTSYQNSIKQVATQSLTNFQNVTHELETSLQKQIKDFHETLLPNLEKEVEVYKEERFKQVEQLINHIIQKVSQKALHKTISLEDHKNLIIEALEKAKKEGVFD